MRNLAAVAAFVALAAWPRAASAQVWLTVDVKEMAPADPDLAAVRAEYASALNAGDPLRLAAAYAADAIAIPAEGVVLRGQDQIRVYFEETCGARAAGSKVALTPQRFTVEDRVASETGLFSESRDGEAGPLATGVYVTIYERGADGAWRIAMEIRTRGRDKQAVRW